MDIFSDLKYFQEKFENLKNSFSRTSLTWNGTKHTWKIGLETWKERIGLPFLNKSMDFFMAFPNLSTNPKCPKGLRKYLNFCNFRCGVLAFFEKIFGWFVLNSAGRCWHQARDFTCTKVQQIFFKLNILETVISLDFVL